MKVLLVGLFLALFCASIQCADMSRYNLRKGQEFLKKNAEKEGVVVLPSGLQYKVIKSGSGDVSPGPSDSVTVHYRGTLIDGTEFDSSYGRGTPANFRVDGVIKGWTEALQLMHVGDKWELYIPSELAYGAPGMGRTIPPNSALIFEVELQDIKGKSGNTKDKKKKKKESAKADDEL